MRRDQDHVWVIAYINKKFIKNIESELREYDYGDIESYIPLVNILKKKYKGKDVYEEIPLLMNYGFFKIPKKRFLNPDFLTELRLRITAIYGWVSDLAKVRNKGMTFDDWVLPRVAMATDSEIEKIIKSSQKHNIHSKDEIERYLPGQIITLKGYPFDGIPAEIIKIKTKSKEVIVKLHINSDMVFKQVSVSYENIFYSVYEDKVVKEDSFEDLGRESNYIIDKLSFKEFNIVEDDE